MYSRLDHGSKKKKLFSIRVESFLVSVSHGRFDSGRDRLGVQIFGPGLATEKWGWRETLQHFQGWLGTSLRQFRLLESREVESIGFDTEQNLERSLSDGLYLPWIQRKRRVVAAFGILVSFV